MSKRKQRPEPVLTPEYVDAFLRSYRWMARSRHGRERTLYRIAEWQREQVARRDVELAVLKGEPAPEKTWVKRMGKELP